MDTNATIDVTLAQENGGNGPYLASLPTDSRVSLATRVGRCARTDRLCRRDRTAGAIRICLGPGVSGTAVYRGVPADRRGGGVYSVASHAGVYSRGRRQSHRR